MFFIKNFPGFFFQPFDFISGLRTGIFYAMMLAGATVVIIDKNSILLSTLISHGATAGAAEDMSGEDRLVIAFDDMPVIGGSFCFQSFKNLKMLFQSNIGRMVIKNSASGLINCFFWIDACVAFFEFLVKKGAFPSDIGKPAGIDFMF